MKKLFWKIYRKFYKLPKLVNIEACSICQLNCRDCYMRKTDKETVIGKGYLKFSNFKEFIEKHPYIESIELSFSGEIFLNPELEKIIEFAYRKGVTLTAVNGVNFNNVEDKMLENLVKYQFKSMTIAMDGTSKETYSIYRRNGNFDKVIENIKKLNEYKKQYNSIYPLLTWQFIVFEHNKEEIKNVKNMAKDLGFKRLSFQESWSKEIKVAKEITSSHILLDCSTEIRNIYLNEGIGSTCGQLWLSPQINWDGELLGCCHSTYNRLDANVFKVGLKNALNSKKLKYMQKVVRGKETPNDTIACNNCSIYKNMREHNSFLNQKKLRFN